MQSVASWTRIHLTSAGPPSSQVGSIDVAILCCYMRAPKPRYAIPRIGPVLCSNVHAMHRILLTLRRPRKDMSEAGHGDLLSSQVRALEDLIRQSPLADERFEWHLIDGSWGGYVTGTGLPAIIHVASGFLFSVEHHDAGSDGYHHWPKGFQFLRHPGIQAKSENKVVKSWDAVLEAFTLWLRLVARELGRTDVPAPTSASSVSTNEYAFVWPLIHADIREIARPRFEAGHRADAVEASLKHINELVQRRVRHHRGRELDGAKLMKFAFSVDNPLLSLGDLSTESGRSMQVGYMELFSGAMSGIRNPKAHANIDIDAIRAIHFIFLASLLRYKLDEAVVPREAPTE